MSSWRPIRTIVGGTRWLVHQIDTSWCGDFRCEIMMPLMGVRRSIRHRKNCNGIDAADEIKSTVGPPAAGDVWLLLVRSYCSEVWCRLLVRREDHPIISLVMSWYLFRKDPSSPITTRWPPKRRYWTSTCSFGDQRWSVFCKRGDVINDSSDTLLNISVIISFRLRRILRVEPTWILGIRAPKTHSLALIKIQIYSIPIK